MIVTMSTAIAFIIREDRDSSGPPLLGDMIVRDLLGE
jgi:hypothetical protein